MILIKMKSVYNTIATLISKSLPAIGVFNKKVYSFVQERKIQIYPRGLKSPIWIHCASLGEFEQGRPVIEAIKQIWPDQAIVLTFFSKSGYDIRKNYPLADWVGYMPLDTKESAKKFIQIIQPRLAIFVKYEYWFNHLDQLVQQSIPFIFISTVLHKDYFLLKSWNRWLFEKVLKASAIFVQDELSKKILEQYHYGHVVVTGDTRIDRVMDIVSNHRPIEYFDQIRARPLFIAGSTWPADEFILKDFLKNLHEHDFILVPHDPSPARVNELNILFEANHPVLHSQWKGEPFRLMIVDSVGLLSRLYRYAQAAYIGGGFGKSIHNILEPAAYGIPVFFGPHHHKFKEAGDLIATGSAFEVQSATEMIKVWNENIPDHLSLIKHKSQKYFNSNKGATALIIDYLRGIIA